MAATDSAFYNALMSQLVEDLRSYTALEANYVKIGDETMALVYKNKRIETETKRQWVQQQWSRFDEDEAPKEESAA